MAHYAFLDTNNIVTEVIVGKNEGEDGIDWEQWYGEFRGQRCIKTSYNNNFRNRFAGIGFSYNETLDIFIEPSPFPSWIFNIETYKWEAPISIPKINRGYYWDEENICWVLPPKPFPSFTLVDHLWTPPTPRPENGIWRWDEPSLSWIEIILPTE